MPEKDEKSLEPEDQKNVTPENEDEKRMAESLKEETMLNELAVNLALKYFEKVKEVIPFQRVGVDIYGHGNEFEHLLLNMIRPADDQIPISLQLEIIKTTIVKKVDGKERVKAPTPGKYRVHLEPIEGSEPPLKNSMMNKFVAFEEIELAVMSHLEKVQKQLAVMSHLEKVQKQLARNAKKKNK